ncbi:MAG TPA: Ca2+-dependent phosphoinositide-specific phospholipase C [Rhizomicrobium sp.]|nr:Ca2+-dependent phosphoinositide-specific phospholipase C [Rhizomicrobium sp.]
MHRNFFAAFVLVPAAAFAMSQAGLLSLSAPAKAHIVITPSAQGCDAHCDANWMDTNLRLDQVQVVGTAESYKQRPSSALMQLIRMGGKKGAEALDYEQPSLEAQLDGDVRALQFDVAYDPAGGAYRNPAGASMAMDLLADDYVKAMRKPGFKVIHVLDVDYRSSCLALADCLRQVAAWSKAHPRHLPLVISLKTNDAKTPMPGATRPLACDEAAMNALEDEIRAVFAQDQMITPDQVQGSHATLREAVMAHAWPKLNAARGKVIFVLDDSAAKAKAYQGTRKSLEGRAMFVATDQASPLAAFVSMPDPVKDGARILQAVKSGFIVSTRADEATREARAKNTARRDAAFASGAQIVQTDFVSADPAIGSYRVSLTDNPAAMCGEKLASEHCVRFESPEGATPSRTAVAAALP